MRERIPCRPGSIKFIASGTVSQSQPPIFAVKGEVLVTNRLDIDFSKYPGDLPGARRRPVHPLQEDAADHEGDRRGIFPDRVQVVFYDVWKDPAPAEKYGIQLIPTQVFLDQKGKEIARHVGLFPKEEILELLKKHGIQ